MLEKYLGKFDIKPWKLVLSVLAWSEKEAYAATEMENILRLFPLNHGCIWK